MTVNLNSLIGISFPDGTFQGSGLSAANTNTSITIPVGTTMQRPPTPNGCAIRFNASDGTYEYYSPNINLWVKF